MHSETWLPTSFPPTYLVDFISDFMNRHLLRSPLVDGFDCVLLNEALKRSDVEPQRSPHLDAGKFPKSGFLVDRVHLKPQVSGSLLDIQEPLTDRSIRPHISDLRGADVLEGACG